MEAKIKIDDLFKIYDQHEFYVDMDFYKDYGMVVLRKEKQND